MSDWVLGQKLEIAGNSDWRRVAEVTDTVGCAWYCLSYKVTLTLTKYGGGRNSNIHCYVNTTCRKSKKVVDSADHYLGTSGNNILTTQVNCYTRMIKVDPRCVQGVEFSIKCGSHTDCKAEVEVQSFRRVVGV